MPHRIHIAALSLSAAILLPAIGISETQVKVAGAPNVQNFPASSVPVSPAHVVHVSFGLAGFQKAAADAYVAKLNDPSSPLFHKWIATSTFGKMFGAPDSDIQALTTYLQGMGFTDVHASAGKSFLACTGTIGIAAKAFNTTFGHYLRPQALVDKGDPSLFFGPKTGLTLPAGLAPKVNGIFGLCNFALMHHDLRISKKQNAVNYSPAVISGAYQSNLLESAGYHGSGMNIGVFSPTLRKPADPYGFASVGKIPEDFTILDVGIDGGSDSPASADGAGEVNLDLDVIIGQAYQSNIFLLEAPGTGSGDSDADYMTGELDGYDTCGIIGSIPVLSSSWDLEEAHVVAEGSQSFAAAFENVCEALCAHGVSIFNSSGDAAGYSNSGDGSVTTKLETSCPYLTSVGGTALYLNSDYSYKGEVLWTFNGNTSSPEGGGGGISTLYKQPTWQTGPGVKNPYSNGYREVPDVSSMADPNTGYYIYYNGAVTGVGGTSGATPLWAVNLLLMEQYYATKVNQSVYLGLMNPVLYQLGNWFENPVYNPNGAFFMYHDITSGNNGVYPTTAYFDNCSGWGSANFYKAWLDIGFTEGVPGFTPDYAPFKATSAWTYPLMIHASTTTVTEPATFSHLSTYYIGFAEENTGNCDGPPAPYELLIDGKVVLSGNFPAVPTHAYFVDLNGYKVTFTAGTHTLKYVVNDSTTIGEVNKANNAYTRTITVK